MQQIVNHQAVSFEAQLPNLKSHNDPNDLLVLPQHKQMCSPRHHIQAHTCSHAFQQRVEVGSMQEGDQDFIVGD